MISFDLQEFARSLQAQLESWRTTTQAALSEYVESGQLLQDLGREARDIIIERTSQRRVDIFGKPFHPYTDHYAGWKKEKFGFTGSPDLKLSGQMLSDIVIQLDSPTSGRLAFSTRKSALVAGSHHKGLPPMPQRPFFGITPGGVDAVHLRERVLHSFSLFLSSRGF